MSNEKGGLPMAIVEEGEFGIYEFEEDWFGGDTINEEDVIGDEREEEIEEDDVIGDEWEEEDIGGSENVEPFVGMEFASEIEAKKFYNTYGGRLGFSVRVHTSAKTKVGISSIRMVCSKQGLSDRQKQADNMGTPQKEISNTRSGCMAFIRFRRFKNGVWKVSKFNAVHNHVLIASPSKRRNLRSLKGMTLEEKAIIRQMRASNVPISQIWHYLGENAGGIDKLCFSKKDVNNQIVEENRRLVGIDVETTLAHFNKKQEEDSEFFFAIEPDSDGVVKNIVWIDGRARRAYAEFGDVVTFDTTYNTNKYCMPLGLFIGVNHHWQSIVFGACLLRNEQATNFIWLFRTWMQAMFNKAPKAIITDQCPSMKAAIQEVFPSIVHRCCQWHVMKNARDQLLVYYGSKDGFKEELRAVINRSLTVADFERSWHKMLEKYKLEDNNHLKTMFVKREEWVPAYFRDTFCAQMSTTQRSEGMNNVMKLLVDNHTSIYRFVLQLEKLVEGIWQRKSDEDYRTINETPQLWSLNGMEVDAREVYTKKFFSLFKKRLKDSSNGSVVEVEQKRCYEVNITKHPSFPNWVPEIHKVCIDMADVTVLCSCKGFEFSGLLCAHAIKVMQHVGIEHLPCKYVLKRWTKGANESVKMSIRERSMDIGESTELQSMRHATLYPKVVQLVHLATKSVEAFRCADVSLDELKNKILTLIPSKWSAPEEILEQQTLVSLSAEEYIDPPISQCKGRKRKPQRMKSLLEKIAPAPKKRTCSYCNEKGGHNLRSCPKRKQDLANGKRKRDEDDDTCAF
ncbi:protein FAR1-RELATED SEQUENCE 5-like isoform X2 [Carex rostrata]